MICSLAALVFSKDSRENSNCKGRAEGFVNQLPTSTIKGRFGFCISIDLNYNSSKQQKFKNKITPSKSHFLQSTSNLKEM
jgi:hypothetical protein